MATALKVREPEIQETPAEDRPPWPRTPSAGRPPPQRPGRSPIPGRGIITAAAATALLNGGRFSKTAPVNGSSAGRPYEAPLEKAETALAPVSVPAPSPSDEFRVDLTESAATGVRAEFTARPVRQAPSPALVARFMLGLVGLLVASAAILAAVWVTLPALVPGWESVVITSDSMAPSIREGDVVISRPSDGTGLGVGTVVIFDDPAGSGLVTHRIVGVNSDGTYDTRGDANAQPDSTPLGTGQVVGAGWILIPAAGLPVVWLSTGAWIKLAAWLLAISLSVWVARYGLLDRYDPWREQDVTH